MSYHTKPGPRDWVVDCLRYLESGRASWRYEETVGRNETCTCGSDKKHKPRCLSSRNDTKRSCMSQHHPSHAFEIANNHVAARPQSTRRLGGGWQLLGYGRDGHHCTSDAKPARWDSERMKTALRAEQGIGGV